MPEANQYTLSHKELVELIIKQCGIHEGRWVLMANLGFAAGNFGPSNDQMSPGAVVSITQLGISRADQNAPREMTVDAAVVNPASKDK
jgi:hypothetical protein